MSMNELESKVNELRELRRMADELHGSNFKITWKEVTSSRLDSKALKAAAPEMWAQFTKQTTTRRFIVA